MHESLIGVLTLLLTNSLYNGNYLVQVLLLSSFVVLDHNKILTSLLGPSLLNFNDLMVLSFSLTLRL